MRPFRVGFLLYKPPNSRGFKVTLPFLAFPGGFAYTKGCPFRFQREASCLIY
jgi:hypothetical protein